MNTPSDFLEYIRNSEFDYSSLRLWEVETLSAYLDPEKLERILNNERNDH